MARSLSGPGGRGEAGEFDELRGARGFLRTLEWSGPREHHLLAIREHGFSLYAGGAEALHFDLEGRLRRAYLEDERGGVNYLRGLDGRTLRKRRVQSTDRGGEPEPPLGREERRRVFARAHGAVREALESLPGGDAPPGAVEGSPRDLLLRAAAYDPDRTEAEAARFLEAYRPLGILPPDRYRSLILQATEGCAYNGCLFCSLYRGQSFRAMTPEEFRDHIGRVKAFLGRALPLRRGIFLGEANALAIPEPQLLSLIEVLREEFPEDQPAAAGGLSSFVDAFTARDKGPLQMAGLARSGLRRVYLGIESGDEDLLSFLRKPSSNEGVLGLVEALKAEGVSVGAILLVGAGGKRFQKPHIERSIALVKSLPLHEDDLVYLSPLVAEPGGRYEAEAAREGVDPLTPEEIALEEAEFRRLLRASPGERGPKVARYDLRSFVYY